MMSRAGLLAAREDGSSLAEVLGAVALIGIAFLTILGGMMTSAVGADVQHKAAIVDLELRAFAEAVKAAPYVDCATVSDYAPAAVGYGAPAGYGGTTEDVDHWRADGSDPTTGTWSNACTTDEGLQRVQLTVSADDGRAAETREVVKRRS